MRPAATRLRGLTLPARLLAALLALGPAGCGGNRYPVEGKVVWRDGTEANELAGGLVVFESADGTNSASGEIREDGSFRMHTIKPGDGVAPGDYRVLVAPPPVPKPDHPPPPVIDPRFSRLGTSELRCTVRPERNEGVVFTVDRARR
jgi:hypothetical protein